MSSWRLDVLQRLEEARLVSEIQKSSPYLRLDFSSLARNPVELKAALGTMAAALGVKKVLRRSQGQWESFLDALIAENKDTPYHNWWHACDVTQFLFVMLHYSKLEKVLCPVRLTALFLAAVCQDVSHDGRSNAFHISEQSVHAVQYMNQSPLEQHHANTAQRIMKETSLLAGLETTEQEQVLQLVHSAIIRTDMTMHGTILAELEAMGRHPVILPITDSTAELLITVLLKAAELSFVARPTSVAELWNARVYAEFYAEGDADKAAGRVTVPLYDRELNSIPHSSCNFVANCALPLLQPLFTLLKGLEEQGAGIDASFLEEVVQHAKRNLQRLQAEVVASTNGP